MRAWMMESGTVRLQSQSTGGIVVTDQSVVWRFHVTSLPTWWCSKHQIITGKENRHFSVILPIVMPKSVIFRERLISTPLPPCNAPAQYDRHVGWGKHPNPRKYKPKILSNVGGANSSPPPPHTLIPRSTWKETLEFRRVIVLSHNATRYSYVYKYICE